ncbi:DNA -binding domain-containing protein [Sphingomonas psychrotolerans]|uniref:DNA -binding domain-containing protein n=1 Tax=Sphingomonas psychrotolerans TaxID=1327635 RepID=UPI003899D8F2
MVLSDGRHHLRLDVRGDFSVREPRAYQYRLHGIKRARHELASLRTFLRLCAGTKLPNASCSDVLKRERLITLLRVFDALSAGASQLEIAKSLYGEARAREEWRGPSDSMRLRVRRLIAQSRLLGRGGYKQLLTERRGNDLALN